MATPLANTASAIDVRALIQQRATDGSLPGARRDPHRLALCIEGGAMRGVVSAGMVAALEQLGLLNVFDRVYGSSAGAMNGAFFVAGQAAFGTTIYYENINNEKFIDFRRQWGRRPVLDLDYLVWDVMCGPKRLDVARVLASPIEFRLLATETATGRRADFGSWTNSDDFLGGLRAGASMPFVSGPPYAYRGRCYWDALLSEPIPARIAEDDGFTHLLVLLTRPAGAPGPRLSMTDRVYMMPRLRRVSPALAKRYAERPREYADLVAGLDRGRAPGGRASVLAVAPREHTVGKLERDRTRLIAAASAGMLAVFDALGHPRAVAKA